MGRRIVAGAALALLAASCSGSHREVGTPNLTAETTSGSPSTTAPAATSTTSTTSAPPVPMVVVVDPGHNGANGRHTKEISRLVDAGGFRKACNTTGTSGGGLTEAEFNWLQSGQLSEALTAAGVTVVLTRDSNDGWGPCIDERGQTAARNNAAALVSIHADGASASSSGFHVIHPARARVGEEVWQKSADLAVKVRDALVSAGFAPANYVGTNGLVERGDLGTLNRAGTPAVMIELGNMRNPEDVAWLADPARRGVAGNAIAQAVTAFISVSR